jgi:hypothetical protein
MAGRVAGAVLFALVFLTAGCPAGSTPPPPDNTNDNTDGDGDDDARIISPSTSFGVSSLDPPVSVLYSVTESASNASGYRVPVASANPGSEAIGERAIVAPTIAVGENQAFSFDPEEAGVGFFRVGILYSLDGVERSTESTASIQVQGSPEPVFIQPSELLVSVAQGTPVFISFDVADPEGGVQWRLFILSPTDSRTNPPDQLGTPLAVGSGNVGTFTLETDDLAPADYQLGLSATDSGDSVADTVAMGDLERIVTIGVITPTPVVRIVEQTQATPPTIAITAPGTADVGLNEGDSFTIRFAGQVFTAAGTGAIDVFYDSDRDLSNGYTLIEADLPVSATTAAFPKDVPEDTYFVGATINDGVNPPQTVYATGRIIVTQ